MSTWIIGDVQGYRGALDRLLEAISYRPGADRLILVGDLVNGGPDNVGALRRVRDLDPVVCLGNQDLRLLAVRAGLWPLREKDNIGDVLDAPDADELADWLRHRTFAWRDPRLGLLAVHAGVLPDWTADRTMELAGEVEAVFRSGGHEPLLAAMRTEGPDAWSEELAGIERLRVIVNALTRLRIVDGRGRMEFDFKAGYGAIPRGWQPWFEHPGRRTADTRVVFGHWSALGLRREGNAVCLDSGIRWGGKLSAYRAEDGAVVQVGP